MDASLLFGRLLLCRALRLGLLGRLCTLAAPLAPPGGLLGLLRRRRHRDRRRSKQLLQVGIGQHALGGAELPDQRLGQLLPAGAAQQEAGLQAALDGGPQRHLPEGIGVPGPQGAHGGLIPLVLADDVGKVCLAPAHQHPQLRDDLEVDGVLAAPDALQVLDLGLGPGAELLHAGKALSLSVKNKDGVVGSQQVDALEPGADVVVTIHQKNHVHECCFFPPFFLRPGGDSR